MHRNGVPKVLLGHMGRDPGLGTALTGGLRMQQEKYCAAAALSLLAPRPLTSWRAEAPCRDWDRRRVVNTWLQSCSSPVSLSLEGCPC